MMAYMGIYSSELSEYGLQPVAVDEKNGCAALALYRLIRNMA